eukprot:CAMPEP_0197916132 /NCGR_PEP_ID=MMETSP1439-20131203/81440_1 /TAXON_ID=66791 /ORGANISM="Gonyaulax spinifera, Strain CCMP409" /LENGTH=197 /DNA_ID=CAMNT_0043538127 /DNA_START=35 /DNA_END=628 /DNA_ORIENTATION=-
MAAVSNDSGLLEDAAGLARMLKAPWGGLWLIGRGGSGDGAKGEPQGEEAMQPTAGLVSSAAATAHDDSGPTPVPAAASTSLLTTMAASSGATIGTQGPDTSRGFDPVEYKNIWQALSQEKSWPSVQRFSVVGPAGEVFVKSVESCVVGALGWEPVEVSTQPRSKWQSVRIGVRCASPDDFCTVHSRLKGLDGVRFIL